MEKVRAYHPDVDEALLNRAYVFAMKAHGSQIRHNGDAYFSHPLEVASILTNLRLDDASVATALLHDTIEDTGATRAEIEELFGTEIAALVDGVTKLTKLELTSEEARQAENFRKLMLAMSSDIRVLLVKLADRLHNMRTLHFVPKPETRHRVALETLDIYAPLAARIGMHAIREELEDLAFAELQPQAHESIVARLNSLRVEGAGITEKIEGRLSKLLQDAGLDAKVTGREKRPYSIWKKMELKEMSFEQLSDVIGFRVLVPEQADCYTALGIIHTASRVVPGRFKDYISTPKRNCYRSIHTTVIGEDGQRIEIQIRTPQMHEVAERGLAAHWSYKDGSTGGVRDLNAYDWLRELMQMLDHTDTAEEFLEHSKLEMFHDQVFCFTPKGDLIGLPQNATPVDFAYAVHTGLGDSCVGAKVNGQRVPLRTVLHNGDQVEIAASDAQSPSPAWESFVVSGRARSAIRRHARLRNREQYIRLGKSILERTFADADMPFGPKTVASALDRLKMKTADDVFAQVGQGVVSDEQILHTIFPELGKDTIRKAKVAVGKNGTRQVPIKGLLPGSAIHLGSCCHPVLGDRIIGIIERGQGVVVHTIDCARLQEYDDDEDRWIDLSWDTTPNSGLVYVARLEIEVENQKGVLASIASVIAKNDSNIDYFRLLDRKPDYFAIQIDVEVRDLVHFENIKAALRATPVVASLSRDRGEKAKIPGDEGYVI